MRPDPASPSNGTTLEIDSSLNNSGLLEAIGGSTIDFKGSAISWTGSATPNPDSRGGWHHRHR
jgi:hypothetical protein